MDGLINANPLAQRLYKVFEPIARKSMNIAVGIAIDLAFGFAMAGIFLVLSGSLPGQIGALKGLVFGLIVWFFRVVMQVASQGMMFTVPAGTLLYTLMCGLAEMLALGLLYGMALTPPA
jgi:hypothetical protein